MSGSILFLLALGLVQNAYTQAIGPGLGCNCNNLGLPPNFVPTGFIPANALGQVNGLGLPLAGSPFGYGDVAVAGELPVGGITSVAGQVPVIGYVTFEGCIPAGGLVSVANNNCGCNGGFY